MTADDEECPRCRRLGCFCHCDDEELENLRAALTTRGEMKITTAVLHPSPKTLATGFSGWSRTEPLAPPEIQGPDFHVPSFRVEAPSPAVPTRDLHDWWYAHRMRERRRA